MTDVPVSELKDYKGIILSGGPMSVYDPHSPTVDRALFNLGVPVLGICYGHQLMQHILGGSVQTSNTKEYGMADLMVLNKTGLFEGVSDATQVWMSHGDNVHHLADGFEEIGRSSDCPFSAVQNLEQSFFGVQFHLEVTHTPEGMTMLDNFLKRCQVRRDWSIEQFIANEVEAIQKKVGDKKVFLLCSGGVDSTVCFALLEKALGPDRVYGLLVDHGMMRYQEADRVKKALNEAGFTNLHVSNQGDLFLSQLAGVAEPEAKRKIIGDLFWQVKEQVAEELQLNPDEWIMGQGTIYPDTIESGGSKHADKIKTHHNRVDLVQQMIDAGKVIEPIAQLYKDEVRQLGESLGFRILWCGANLSQALVWECAFCALTMRWFSMLLILLSLTRPFRMLLTPSMAWATPNYACFRFSRLVCKGMDVRTVTRWLFGPPAVIGICWKSFLQPSPIVFLKSIV
ncbi:glutamine-hydrolyzing GMP synthase [Candidatus Peregrinibacteria bacterium]|nr:MAG: glutamine-hydrolyzing GMP synthase [Candidatus Peregrinibacteria bacterium]